MTSTPRRLLASALVLAIAVGAWWMWSARSTPSSAPDAAQARETAKTPAPLPPPRALDEGVPDHSVRSAVFRARLVDSVQTVGVNCDLDTETYCNDQACMQFIVQPTSSWRRAWDSPLQVVSAVAEVYDFNDPTGCVPAKRWLAAAGRRGCKHPATVEAHRGSDTVRCFELFDDPPSEADALALCEQASRDLTLTSLQEHGAPVGVELHPPFGDCGG